MTSSGMRTLAIFAVFSAVLWLNALVNHYLFNMMIALVASVPVLFLLVRGGLTARSARRQRSVAATR